MDINRNQYFMAGIVILVLGIQMRVVESFVLTEDAGRFVAEKMDKIKKADAQSSTPAVMMIQAPSSITEPRRMITPPRWLGWALISIGAVLVLHSLAMKRPG